MRNMVFLFPLVLLFSGCSQPNTPTQTSAPTATQPRSSPAAQIMGTPDGTVMTPEYVAAVGRFAYIWGWPLVNNFNRANSMKDLPGPGRIGDVVPATPPGYVSMLTDYISAKEKFVTCPNQDTVYGAGFQRTDTKPVVIPSAKTWRQFADMIPVHDWNQLRQILDEDDTTPDLDSKFQSGSLPGFEDGDWPDWAEQHMLGWLPPEACAKYSEVHRSVINGPFLSFDPKLADQIVDELERAGFVCQRDDGLVIRACGR